MASLSKLDFGYVALGYSNIRNFPDNRNPSPQTTSRVSTTSGPLCNFTKRNNKSKITNYTCNWFPVNNALSACLVGLGPKPKSRACHFTNIIRGFGVSRQTLAHWTLVFTDATFCTVRSDSFAQRQNNPAEIVRWFFAQNSEAPVIIMHDGARRVGFLRAKALILLVVLNGAGKAVFVNMLAPGASVARCVN